MNPIDHSNTYALLIGASNFPEDPSIIAIPNVNANLKLLKQCLVNPDLIGIPDSNITVSLNENKIQIEKRLRSVADKTNNKKYTLLVYYSGHGILSSEDFRLYLATHYTGKQDLEIDGVNIEDFKKYIKKSVAGRKIVILDCCHSGAIIGSMGTMPSKIQAELNGFEGTYVMTSAAEETPSLFPVDKPDEPTFFTGKFLEIINEGMESDNEYCSLREIYNKIEKDFTTANLPRPQQSNFNTADQLYFSLNKKFTLRKTDDEIAWDEALNKNSKLNFFDFKNKYPSSPFAKLAKQKISELEEDENWLRVSKKNTLTSLDNYLEDYPDGRYVTEAIRRIQELREKDQMLERTLDLKEQTVWNQALKSNTVLSFSNYLQNYPSGRFAGQAQNRIQLLEETGETAFENKIITQGININNNEYKLPEQSTSELVEKNKRTAWYVGIGIVLLIIILIIVIPDRKSDLNNNSSVDTVATVFAAEKKIIPISLTDLPAGLLIIEDSLKYYMDYDELLGLRDSYGHYFSYRGGVLNGKPEGYGIAKYDDGDRYAGKYKNGQRSGKGLFTWKNGGKYDGEWEKDKMDGRGVEIWTNGERFEGYWKNGKKHGYGTSYDKNNNVKFDGRMENDVPVTD